MGIWSLITIVLVLVCTGTVWYIEEKSRASELAEISAALECILNGKELSGLSLNEETLLSKIRHQLFRLQNMTKGYHRRLFKDQESIKKMSGEIAHQLRMPLTNMETYLEFLRQEGNSAEEQELYLDAVAASEQKIHFLVESFIRMSRLENRMLQIRREDMDLLATIWGAEEQIRKKAKEQELTIQMKLPGSLPYAHDAGWLGEAIFNIIDNAVK